VVVANILDDEGDVHNVRMAMIRIKATLNVASYDYAHAALGAAQEAYTAARSAAPCSQVWRHMIESQTLLKKSGDALQACLSATAMLLNAEETGDDYIDGVNAEVKVETIEQHVISAMMEGANSRLKMTQAMLPDHPAPGARCQPEKLGGVPNGG
jgi:hypothetical protein